MAEESLEHRVDMLEHQMQALIELPERVASIEAQILLLRTEMREEFSALRAEIHLGDNASRGETRSTAERIRDEALATAEGLRAEIRAGDEETRRLMRILHEDVISRIAALGEGRA